MSRNIRRISAIDIAQKEHPADTLPLHRDYYPPYPARRNNSSILHRLRQSNTQALITGSCSNMREFCSSIQGITAEVNNLLTSIENFLPLINTYLNSIQPRETIAISSPEAENTAQNKVPAANTGTNPTTLPKLRPEDIQQLLENPLVKNLLSSFVQNAALPKNN